MSNRPRTLHETRAGRARRDFWMKLGVWIFIALFIFSVAGGVIAFTVAR